MEFEDKKKEYPWVVIKWKDARSFDDTYDIGRVFDSCTVESVGRLHSKTDKDTVIFRDFYGDESDDLEVSGVLVVPNVWIESLEYLKNDK